MGTPCPGVWMIWPLGDFYTSYPFQRHSLAAPSLGYRLCAIDAAGQRFVIRSDNCTSVKPATLLACDHCVASQAIVDRLVEIARGSGKFTNHKYLSYSQLSGAASDSNVSLRLSRVMVSTQSYQLQNGALIHSYSNLTRRRSTARSSRSSTPTRGLQWPSRKEMFLVFRLLYDKQ